MKTTADPDQKRNSFERDPHWTPKDTESLHQNSESSFDALPTQQQVIVECVSPNVELFASKRREFLLLIRISFIKDDMEIGVQPAIANRF
mmetsp:Transcript_4977/g.12063  ORF Transcript_4977/g.12063 Transcript_4977/m.12063 type:complete len:90 (-) Transcript_4977:766-1035(-)